MFNDFIQQKQAPDVFCKKGILRNFTKFTEKHLCQSLLFNKVDFIKKETLAQVFSCKFCEISKNTFLYRTPLAAASEVTEFFWTDNKIHSLLESVDQY